MRQVLRRFHHEGPPPSLNSSEGPRLHDTCRARPCRRWVGVCGTHVRQRARLIAISALLVVVALGLLMSSREGGLLRLLRRPPRSAWEGIADVGPASSPAAWQATQPPLLLISYATWPGVFAAASAQGPVLSLPLSFSPAHAQRLVDLVARTPSLRAVVVHGIPWGSLDLARLLRAQVPALRILFVYHGAPSAPFHVAESRLVADLIEAENAGVVDAIGAVKAGFAETLARFGARKVFSVPNFPVAAAILPTSKYSAADGRVHVGVFASNDALHKNVATQVVAACSVRGAVVHVTFLPQIAYLRGCDVVVTGFLEHGRFLVELSRMDVLSYVTLTECYPMLVLEAMAAGVPVVVSRTHRIFDSDPELVGALVVAEADNPSEIAAKIASAAGDAENLRRHLLSLTLCLRHAAELEWGKVLGLSEADSRRAQLVAFADGGAAQATCQALPEAPALPVFEIAAAPSPRIRIAFLTYELAPVLPGGMGVVLSGLIEDLLEAGHSVTVLAYVSEATLAKWGGIMEGKGWKVGPGRQLTLHHVPTLARETELDARACGPRNIFLRRSWLFALAAKAAYDLDPFSAIETFDYVGAGFELTRRLTEWRQAGARGESASVAPPYLPEHVPILVRLHGSLQLIHQHEGTFTEEVPPGTPRPCLLSDSEREAWPLMYLMERFTLRAADLLLPQSSAMKTVYAHAYGVAEVRMLLAPPPMARITAPMRAMARSTPAFPAAEGGAAELRLLVYGRVMRAKGSETVAEAASAIIAALPVGATLRLIFAGLDWDCPLHRRPSSQCVLELLPRGAHATFLGQIEHGALAQMLPTVHGAILASEFETFGMAAHELAAAGLPLIISDIPAFGEFFTANNAYVFASGNAGSLAKAVSVFVADLIGNAPRVARLNYADAVTPYERASAAGLGESKDVLPGSDLRLLEAAMSKLEGECWPSAGNKCEENAVIN